MKNYKLLSIILLGILLANCEDKKKSEKSYFAFDESKLKETYLDGESVVMQLKNDSNQPIDSVIYYFNDKNIGAKKGIESSILTLDQEKLGYKNLKALVYFDKKTEEVTKRVEIISNVTPKLLTYSIVNIYPHDTKSYTQGLEFYRDTLFEGTGQKGSSKLMKTDYKTGKKLQTVNLEGKYFGEGITILNNKVYQLTWRENTGFVYNADNLKKIKDFSYFKSIEGWGLCNDGNVLYQSDGTEKIWVLDPETLKEIDYINVYSGTTKIKSINELEWVDGKIYGNVYQKDAVARINPKTGAVEGILNLAELKSKVNVQDIHNEVLNGIAYNPKTKTFFITGKNWDKMFEIKVNE